MGGVLTIGVTQTLRMSKIQAPIFQYYIVHSPLAKSFTSLLFDLPGSPSDMPAFAVFSHLVGLLPNISILEGFTTATLSSVCGLYGLITVPLYELGPGSPSDVDLIFNQNRNLLLKLSNRLTDLDVAIDATQLELLVGSNPGGFRKLGITSSWRRQRSILGSSNTKFPAVLAQCPNLETLSLGQLDTGDSDNEEDDDDDVDPIHDSVLEVPYSFADNLRSLTLNFPHSSFPTSINELRFAALFPSLLHLSISIRTPLDPPQPKIVLPSLTTLEVRHIYKSHCITALLHSLEMPSLSALRLITYSGRDLFSPVPATAKMQGEAVADSLTSYRPTLATLNLVTNSIQPPPRELYRLFTRLEGSVAIIYNSKHIHEQSRRLSSVQSRQCSSDNTQVNSTPRTDRFSASALASEESSRVLKWATDYVERTKGTDKTGARELYEALKPVEHLMEWMKE